MIEGAICPKCGKEFFPYPEHVYTAKGKRYCSWSCFNHRNEGKIKIARAYKCKIVQQYTLDGKFLKEYKSANQAAEYMGCTANAIRNVCKGKVTSRTKFIWKYKE